MRRGPAIQIALALILACFASPAFADGTPRARLLGSFPWVMDQPWFGGWSGIEISSDGRMMTAITDRGRILGGEITRQGDLITAITPDWTRRMKASTGKHLTPGISDSEGLVVTEDGTIFISFEGVARVSRYADPAAPAQALRRHEAFRGLPRNKSFEALALDRKGRLFTIPERLGSGKTIQVFVLEGGIWTAPFTLEGEGGFLPVGADFGPDGRLYLLERAWGFRGFRARVRRWEMVDGNPHNEELLVLTDTGTHDNLEGLAVWRDPRGRTRLTMIADDNFKWFQRTELVEYVLQD